MDDLQFVFTSETEAESFGQAYTKDEPGSYFSVGTLPNGRYYVNLFEEDGYQINRPAPRMTLASAVKAPRAMAYGHLG